MGYLPMIRVNQIKLVVPVNNNRRTDPLKSDTKILGRVNCTHYAALGQQRSFTFIYPSNHSAGLMSFCLGHFIQRRVNAESGFTLASLSGFNDEIE